MPATVTVDQLTVVHQSSNGMVTFMPDVCLTPGPPGPPIPIPYPNIAMSTDTAMGSRTVTCDGNPIMLQGSRFSQSTGDEAGTAGGVMSVVTKGAAEFISYSFDVTVDGKPVARFGDLMLGNKGGTFNTPPSPEVQPPLPPDLMPVTDETQAKPDAVHIKLVDGGGKPLKDTKYVLIRPDGTKEEGKTDGAGEIHVQETVSGVGQVLFPDLENATLRPKP